MTHRLDPSEPFQLKGNNQCKITLSLQLKDVVIEIKEV